MADDDNEMTDGSQRAFEMVNAIKDAPTVFADGCIFVAVIGSSVRISFVETILNPANGPDPGVKTKHVANVVMPREGFENMRAYFNSTSATWTTLTEDAQKVEASVDDAGQ